MSALVIHVGFGPLGQVIDLDRVRAISPDAEVVVEGYHLGHDQRTRRSHEPGATDLAEIDLPLPLLQALANADILFSLDAPLDLPRLAPRLRWIQAMGSGVGQFAASGLAGIPVILTNAAGVASAPIAEWVLARILQIYKRLDLHADQQRRHEWETAMGSLVAGRRALVVGLGAIGVDVALRLRAFGVHVVGVRRSWTPGLTDPSADEVIGPDALMDALATSDIVVVAAPGTAANEDLFGAAAFAAMPEGSVFVNVARGTLVDEEALMAALRSGHLRGAAIDVARVEPLPPESPLWDTPNLSISPHSSASGERYLERAADLFYDNLSRFVAGTPLRNVVDLSGGY